MALDEYVQVVHEVSPHALLLAELLLEVSDDGILECHSVHNIVNLFLLLVQPLLVLLLSDVFPPRLLTQHFRPVLTPNLQLLPLDLLLQLSLVVDGGHLSGSSAHLPLYFSHAFGLHSLLLQ